MNRISNPTCTGSLNIALRESTNRRMLVLFCMILMIGITGCSGPAVLPENALQMRSTTAASCLDLLVESGHRGSGIYTIDPDGAGGNAPFDVYCDMTTDGGGWTLVSSKIDNAQRNNQLSAFQQRRCLNPNQTCFGHVAPDEPLRAIRVTNDEVSIVVEGRNWRDGFRAHLNGTNPVSAWGPVTPGIMFDRIADVTSIKVNGQEQDKGSDPNAIFLTSVRQTQHSPSHYITLYGHFSTIGFQSYYGLSPASVPANIYGSSTGSWKGTNRSHLSVWYRAKSLPPAASCAELLDRPDNRGDGVYMIDPDGAGGNAPFDVYCDMTTDGGGWTLVSSKIDNAQRNNQLSAFQQRRCLNPNQTCFGHVAPDEPLRAIRVTNDEVSIVVEGRNWRDGFRAHLNGTNPVSAWGPVTPGIMFDRIADVTSIKVNGQEQDKGSDPNAIFLTSVRQTQHSPSHYITLYGHFSTIGFQSYYGLSPASVPANIYGSSTGSWKGTNRSHLSVWYRACR